MIQSSVQNIWCRKSAVHPGGTELTERMLIKARQGDWIHNKDYILDVGCGQGSTVSCLRSKGYLAAGIDPDTDRPDLYRGDAGALPWPEGHFDGVIAECTLSVIGIEKALPEIVRVLKPGGIFLVSDICEKGVRPLWTSSYPFRVLYLEDATPLLGPYISAWIWQHTQAPPACFDNGRKIPLKNLGYYWAILQLTEGGDTDGYT